MILYCKLLFVYIILLLVHYKIVLNIRQDMIILSVNTVSLLLFVLYECCFLTCILVLSLSPDCILRVLCTLLQYIIVSCTDYCILWVLCTLFQYIILFLMKLSFTSCKKQKKSKKKQKTKKQLIEKNAILFSILHILHILLFIIIKFYVNVSFHIILLLCVVQNYFFLFYPGCKWFSWSGVLSTPG